MQLAASATPPQIEERLGAASESLEALLADPTQHSSYDFAFIDADKKVGELCLGRLVQGQACSWTPTGRGGGEASLVRGRWCRGRLCHAARKHGLAPLLS